MPKHFLIFGIYYLKITLLFYLQLPHPLADVLKGYIILHRPDLLCQRPFLVSIAGHIPHLVKMSVNCLRNTKSAVCVNICLVPWSHRKMEYVAVFKSRPAVMRYVFQVVSNFFFFFFFPFCLSALGPRSIL